MIFITLTFILILHYKNKKRASSQFAHLRGIAKHPDSQAKRKTPQAGRAFLPFNCHKKLAIF
jgi:hypothetical protein